MWFEASSYVHLFYFPYTLSSILSLVLVRGIEIVLACLNQPSSVYLQRGNLAP